MPITIQEIIASDTISQLVDKVNYNFDQLMLNGGGPAGPIGPAGPTGPVGGRGPKGTTWYTGAVPPSTIVVSADLREGDFYLQGSDSVLPSPVALAGDVWEYNGTVWVLTTTNLEGPTGPAGQTGGFSQTFGILPGSVCGSVNTVYPAPAGGTNTGADANNEGILTVAMGGAPSCADTSGSGFNLSSEYIIPDDIASVLQSPNTVLFLHQKNSQARAVVFQGGANAGNTENYEQNGLGNLSALSLQPDDMLRIDVPKGATAPNSNAANVGFQVYSPLRGHDYHAGGQIKIASGQAGAAPAGAWYNANLELVVGTGGLAAGNKFSTVVQGTSASGTLELGNNITPVVTPQITAVAAGEFQLTGSDMRMVANQASSISLIAGNQITLDAQQVGGGAIKIQSDTGGISLDSEGGNISIIQDDAATPAEIIIRNDYAGNAVGGDIYIHNRSQIILKDSAQTASHSPSIVINNENGTTEHTRFVGRQTWSGEDPASGSGILPPASGAQRYFYSGRATNSTPTSIMSQYGDGADSSITWQAGALYSSFQLGDGNQGTGTPSISLDIGKDRDGGTLGMALETLQNASPSGIVNKHQYFKVSAQGVDPDPLPTWPYRYGQTMSAVPFVYNRSWIKGKNAPENGPSVPSYYVNGSFASQYVQQTAQYGFNLTEAISPDPDALIPKEALNHPFIAFTMAPYYGSTVNQGLQSLTNYLFYLNFPIAPEDVAAGGQIPGSDYRVTVTNMGARFEQYDKQGAVDDYNYYGTLTVRVPVTRFSTNSGASWKPWNYKEIPISVSQGIPGSNTQYINHWHSTLTYDGAMMMVSTSPNVSTSPSGRCDVVMQMGYVIGDESAMGQYTYGNNFCPVFTCFIAGTQVLMADGSSKNIEDVEVGEKVAAFDGINTVLELDRPSLGMRMLYSINGGKHFVTSEHPFYTTEGWKSIDPNALIEENPGLAEELDVTTLAVGDIIVTSTGQVKVEEIDANSGYDVDMPLYNFKLDGDNTYYADGYLTHNK